MVRKPTTVKSKAATSRGKTMVSFILDETGSMNDHKSSTISGFNEYIDSLKDQKHLTMSLTKFNSNKIEVVYKDVPLSRVPRLDNETYCPASTTPLYDAIGHTIHALGAAKKVLMIIMTDGLENDSSEFTQKKIFALIRDKEKEGWTFVYLGANQDAWQAGEAIGLRRGNVANFKQKNTQMMFRAVAECCRNYDSLEPRTPADFFKEEDEKKLMV
jgi:hypothetical protein